METKNKGEWSELYVFLKLLADQRLYAADANLNRIEDIYYPILSIFHEDYVYHANSEIKIVDSFGNLILSVPVREFKENSILLLNKIQTSKGSSFAVQEIQEFLQTIKVSKIKAKSSEKRDITIVVHDIFTGFNPKLGFSIKSRLGGSSTLLNASKQTNFVYEIQCENYLTSEEIDWINSLDGRSKIRDRISSLFNKNCNLRYRRMDSTQFFNNLIMIDSALPVMLAEMLKLFYGGYGTTITDLTRQLTHINPLNFDLSRDQPFYEYKIKNFLTDIALGMTPKTPWNGIYDATGGYIVVKEDGEVLCYHIYNRNDFQEYLFRNTKLETPSSGRHEFGVIYPEDGSPHIKLNLQVRFI